MHHIGGRGGDFPDAINEHFRKDYEFFIYDADPGCFEHMKLHAGDINNVISTAVTGSDGQYTLHVNFDPYTSSLLPANPASRQFFYNNGVYDYVLEDVTKLVKTVRIDGRSLDSLALTHGFQVDYLSLDTQGTEFDILAGASDATLGDTVAIRSEVSFVPFYENQKLCEDVMALLRTKGFFPAKFFKIQNWASSQTSIGWRGTGFSVHGDMLFFREIPHIVRLAREPFSTLLKMAYISMCFGNVAYAIESLIEAYKNPQPNILALADKIRYIGFLDKMYQLYLNSPQIFPMRFRHWFTVEQSMNRFEVGNDSGSASKVDRQAQAIAAYMSEVDAVAHRRTVSELLKQDPTPFETHLRSHGFAPLAETVAARRRADARSVPHRR